MWLLLVVAGGSAAGGVCRYLLSGALQRPDATFPVGTLTVNLVGSFALGALARYASMSPTLTPEMRLLIGAGFCGGFTTFSTFSVETLELMQHGTFARASGYVGLSVIAGLAAAMAGMATVRSVLEP